MFVFHFISFFNESLVKIIFSNQVYVVIMDLFRKKLDNNQINIIL
jgi:hypothetical protein